jgi:hypothetical protein
VPLQFIVRSSPPDADQEHPKQLDIDGLVLALPCFILSQYWNRETIHVAIPVLRHKSCRESLGCHQ